MNGLIVDLFAGGGGASTGLEAALGRDVDIAINHSETALAVHETNHPRTKHLVTGVWEVDPRVATQGKPVAVLWLSPDCTHFSVAKGKAKRSNGTRSLAWVALNWVRKLGHRAPQVIFLENVREFLTWGPLYPEDHPVEKLRGQPIPERKGETFAQWRGSLELLGYKVDWRVLDASEYGAPTKRKRLFLVARRDGQPIQWPAKTHGPGLLPLHTAAECIDWSIPCPSIFERKKPLAEKTLWRIAQGIRRFVLESASPFIVHVNHGGMTDRSESIDEPLSTVTASRRGHALVAPTLVQTGYGERPGQRPRFLNLHEPLGTLMAGGQKHALVSAFLAKHYGGVVGQSAEAPIGTVTTVDHHSLVTTNLVKMRGDCIGSDAGEPLPTITASGMHLAEVRAFLTAYYGSAQDCGQSVRDPMRTVVTKDRLGLVTVEGVEHVITDIGMRMLEPHELLRAQFGRFAATYDLSAAKTKSAKVKLLGNSVCPEAAEAVVRANLSRAIQEAA